MFKLGNYNCCSWWHVPIERNHRHAFVHHLTSSPPCFNGIDSSSSIDQQLQINFGRGSESDPFRIERHSSAENVSRRNSLDKKRIRLVCLSDTHNRIEEISIPNGDIFLHCGDASNHWTNLRDLRRFNQFVGNLPHRYKLFVSGNHDLSLHSDRIDFNQKLLNNMIYLQDQLVQIEGITIYGSPWRPKRGCFYRSEGFGYDIQRIREDKWSRIPSSIDILLTHCPPFSIRDYNSIYGHHLGCPHLLDEIVTRIQPRIHLFGHIHQGYGASLYRPEENLQLQQTNSSSNIFFINVAIHQRRQMRNPIIIDYIY